jgi:hypothetical protein
MPKVILSRPNEEKRETRRMEFVTGFTFKQKLMRVRKEAKCKLCNDFVMPKKAAEIDGFRTPLIR